jgi:hypothetical protein
MDDVEHSLIGHLATGAGEEFYTVEVEGMRERLGYEDATELERMLLDRIVVCWLRLQDSERTLSAYLEETILDTPHSRHPSRSSG